MVVVVRWLCLVLLFFSSYSRGSVVVVVYCVLFVVLLWLCQRLIPFSFYRLTLCFFYGSSPNSYFTMFVVKLHIHEGGCVCTYTRLVVCVYTRGWLCVYIQEGGCVCIYKRVVVCGLSYCAGCTIL